MNISFLDIKACQISFRDDSSAGYARSNDRQNSFKLVLSADFLFISLNYLSALATP
jgi:hypothetical protein